MYSASTAQRGFTLIELSIVLVVIGLIVGGVLVGQDLIKAAYVRATITQIEKYNQATNTFYAKYGALPGDLNAATAAQFGFALRGIYGGEGDGNGRLEGNELNSIGRSSGVCEATGETGLFWVDLSTVNLIDGTFNTATATTVPTVPRTALASYFPAAKMGAGNYIYVWSGGYVGDGFGPGTVTDNRNYFGLSAISSVGVGYPCIPESSPELTVFQANAIDTKIDDGLPQSGNVTALYINTTAGGGYWAAWAAGGGNQGASTGSNAPTTAATPGSSTTCYDNSSASSGTPGVAGAVQHYSLEISSGSNVNCALSFKMQAGD